MPDDPIDGEPLDGEPIDPGARDSAPLDADPTDAGAQNSDLPDGDLPDGPAELTAMPPAAGDELPPEPMPDALPEAVSETGGAGASIDAAAITAELSSIVGSDADALYAFGRGAGETVLVGLESVANQRTSFSAVTASIADFADLNADYEGVPHLGLELRVALDETEVYSVGLILRLEDVGRLLSIETAPEQMADEEFARAQIEVVSGSVREFLDLAGLMMFSDELAGTEITLGEVRPNAIQATVAALAEAAGEPIGLRIDCSLAFPDGSSAPITLGVPAGLVARLAALSAAAPAGAASREEELAAADSAAIAAPELGEMAAPELGGIPAGDGPPFPELPAFGGLGGQYDDVAVHPVRFPALGPSDSGGALPSSIDLILDVSLRVTVELGRSSLTVQEVLALGPGSVVELNKLAGEPVDILINDRPIARGEVVVVDENFGVRVTEVLLPRNRIEAVGRHA